MNDIPSLRRFRKGDRVYVQAQQIWIVLTCLVMRSDRNPRRPFVVTYGDLAEAMGMNRRAGITLGRQLGIVGHLCVMNDLAALNSIVVNDATNEPGDHVVTRPGKTYKQEQAEVMKENWHGIRVPTTGTLRKVWEAINREEE
jgi:hypothetical protein